DQVFRAAEAVHPGHRVVTFGDVSLLEETFQLFLLRTRSRNWLRAFTAPDAFGTLRDEGAVALLALAQRLFRLPAVSDVARRHDDTGHHQIIQPIVGHRFDDAP